MQEPQTFYHVSSVDLGSSPVLKAKIPSCAGKDEPAINRVCFSSSILGCLNSIHSGLGATIPNSLVTVLEDKRIKDQKFNERGFLLNIPVYYTNESLTLPPDISDFRKNKEYWSLTDIKVKRLGYIDVRKTMLEDDTNYKGVYITRNKYTQLTKEQYNIIKKIVFQTSVIKDHYYF